jgi:hypothetical protein
MRPVSGSSLKYSVNVKDGTGLEFRGNSFVITEWTVEAFSKTKFRYTAKCVIVPRTVVFMRVNPSLAEVCKTSLSSAYLLPSERSLIFVDVELKDVKDEVPILPHIIELHSVAS